MIYTFLNLKMAGLLVGLALLLGHLVAFFRRDSFRSWLMAFPRSRLLGIVLTVVAALWTFALVTVMDLTEFTSYRGIFQILVPIAAVLAILYVDEFLAVRATGMLLLLLAEPVLEATDFRLEQSRLLLVVLAYVWVVLGLFWVGMPYLMRDQLQWLAKNDRRWNLALFLGMTYGAAILVCAVVFYPAA
jgi:hypothetical protein